MSKIFQIKRELVQEIFAQARQESPAEACGMLGGQGDMATAVYPAKNVDASHLTYSIDPAEAFKVIKQMREDGVDFIASYHSHPATKAYPSPTDCAKAGDTELVYVIVSLRRPGDSEIRGFKIRGGLVEEIELRLI